MEFVTSVSDLVSAVFVFVVGAWMVSLVGIRFRSSTNRSLVIYCWHTLFCLVYLWYVLNNGGDALAYYDKSIADGFDFEFAFGTAAVTYLTALLTQGLGLSLLGTFLIFNFFGAIGLIAFDASLRHVTKGKSRKLRLIATLIVFLPSVSFWSSAIGKDSLSFMAAGLALWAALNLSRRMPLMAFAVVIMLLVRPHMAGIMVISLLLASLRDHTASLTRKMILGGIAAAAVAALVPFALKYAGVGEDVTVDSLTSYVETRQSHNMQGGGGVDIANMILPMQLFTYMFRPIIFEARTVFALAAAIDNLILLYLFVAGGRLLLIKQTFITQENRVFMWSYSLLAWATLALSSANLGIALRQKWMFAPMLIFLLLSVIARNSPSTVRSSSRKKVVAQNVRPAPYSCKKTEIT